MTFKGVTYQSLIEIERLIIVQEAVLKAYELELKFRRLQREKEEVQTVLVKINLQENFITELKQLREDLIEKIDILLENLNETEGKVFLRKFVLGKDNQEIMEELAISQPTLYRHYDSIQKELEETKCGNDLKESLTE